MNIAMCDGISICIDARPCRPPTQFHENQFLICRNVAPMRQPDISVVLCTHNPRDDYLDRVLIGLRSQTLSFQRWELLLIDNASNEPLADRFDIGWHPNGRHVREDELGVIVARLRGIAEAAAELLLY